MAAWLLLQKRSTVHSVREVPQPTTDQGAEGGRGKVVRGEESHRNVGSRKETAREGSWRAGVSDHSCAYASTRPPIEVRSLFLARCCALPVLAQSHCGSHTRFTGDVACGVCSSALLSPTLPRTPHPVRSTLSAQHPRTHAVSLAVEPTTALGSATKGLPTARLAAASPPRPSHLHDHRHMLAWTRALTAFATSASSRRVLGAAVSGGLTLRSTHHLFTCPRAVAVSDPGCRLRPKVRLGATAWG